MADHVEPTRDSGQRPKSNKKKRADDDGVPQLHSQERPTDTDTRPVKHARAVHTGLRETLDDDEEGPRGGRDPRTHAHAHAQPHVDAIVSLHADIANDSDMRVDRVNDLPDVSSRDCAEKGKADNASSQPPALHVQQNETQQMHVQPSDGSLKAPNPHKKFSKEWKLVEREKYAHALPHDIPTFLRTRAEHHFVDTGGQRLEDHPLFRQSISQAGKQSKPRSAFA